MNKNKKGRAKGVYPRAIIEPINCRCISAHTVIALSTNSENINKKKELLLQAAARCRHNGKYEICALWISMYKKLVAKYGC